MKKTVSIIVVPEKDLESAAKLYFSNWVQLATTPFGSALDSTKMFLPVALPRGSRSRAAAKNDLVWFHRGKYFS